MVRRLVPLLLLTAALVAPAAASQGKGPADEDASEVLAVPPDPRFGGPGSLSIIGSPAANDISVEVDLASNRFIVHDPVGAVPAETTGPYPCFSLSSTTVSCPRLGSLVRALMRAGDDTLTLGSGVTGSVNGNGDAGADRVVLPRDHQGHLRFRGGRGADVAAGGSARDKIIGSAGADRLRGRAGPDTIIGETGADRASGGSGDDRLLMKADDRDRAINCGSGGDLAVIDRNLDPRPRHCERITAGR
jgi:hemolysin type calcium-binding protein